MEKTQLKQFERHDFVAVSQSGRDRICLEVLDMYSVGAQPLVKKALLEANNIPGIVRRAENYAEDEIPVGFVPFDRFNDMRLRVAAFTKLDEVITITKPKELLKLSFAKRNRCMAAVAKVAEYAESEALDLGVLGSAGLEIYTKLPYTNEESDIDLLIGSHKIDTLKGVYARLKEIGKEFNIPIDLEVALPNGYGVKAAELFMQTEALLGKSIKDVALLKRIEVQEALNKS